MHIAYLLLWIELDEVKITGCGIFREDFLQNKSTKTLTFFHESQVYSTIGIKLIL